MELGSWWAVGENQTSLPLRESTASFHSTPRGREQQISSQECSHSWVVFEGKGGERSGTRGGFMGKKYKVSVNVNSHIHGNTM